MIFNSSQQLTKINKLYYCTKNTAKNKLYSHTLLLPKTKFPLRLDNKKLIERDEYIYGVADFENFYFWQRSHLSEPEFVLHDGPPYANGHPHMGHAINKILKDAILRCQVLQGNKVHYIPGWDCHGLPIEMKALTSSDIENPIEIRKKARDFATKTIQNQKQIFKSWGLIGDWKGYYTTYSIDYVKMQLRQFFKIYNKQYIYRDIKPVFWSPSSRTALAEAELEYNETHKSPSVYIRFKMKNIPKLNVKEENCIYALIWTTTPWTLPANSAVCYSENLNYAMIKKSDVEVSSIYIVACNLIQDLRNTLNWSFDVLQEFPGTALEGSTYFHPIYRENTYSFVNGSHVKSSKGTGLVHSAPAHGPDDFLVSIISKIPRFDFVNELGCYNAEAGSNLQGKEVLTDGNKTVLEIVKSDIVHLSELTHSYPYDWRTKKPVIIRASQQWFIDTTALKNRAVELLENVEIVPKDKGETYKKDLINQIQKRPYWCISRQRKWGVPIPVFYNKETSEVIINENTIRHCCNLLEKHGTDFWWNLPLKELLPENIYPTIENVEQGQDIMDIWLDSGLSWGKVLEGTKVADMYLEGVDQFRGWFQSSLLTSVALRDKSPYTKIYVHGFAVDEKGNKMSKSLGNVVDPVDIINGTNGQKPYGIDTLRWWVTCHVNHTPLASVNPSVLQSSAEEIQKIRGVLRFALGALSDYEKSDEDHKNLLLIDKYILHLLYHFQQQVSEYESNYQFHKISHTVIEFLTNAISALYYTSIKDRLYCDSSDNSSRRSAQYTLLQIFEIVTKSIAPMIPHFAEEMYLYFPQKSSKTYFTRTPPKPELFWVNDEVKHVMDVILNCKRDINKVLGVNTIDAEVSVQFSKDISKSLQLLNEFNDLGHQLEDIFQVSSVVVTEDEIPEQYQFSISKSNKFSCVRCRKIQAEKRDDVCQRCYNIICKFTENKTSVSN